MNDDSPRPELVSPRPNKAKRTQAPPKTIEEVPEPPPPPPPTRTVTRDHRDYSGFINGLSPERMTSGPPEQHSLALLNSPTMTEMLQLAIDEDQPENINMDNFQLTETDPSLDPSLADETMNIDDLANDDDSLHDLPLSVGSPQRDLMGNITPTGVPEHIFNTPPLNYIYPQPYMGEDSPEMLSFRFAHITCGILSIMDGPHENPWRTLIWPIAQHSQALYHALFAMTAFHNVAEVPQLRVVGHEHKQQSIRYIQEGIRDNSMGDQTAIATALALGFAESWDQHTSTGNTHIKGAQALVRRALGRHRREPLQGEDLARLKFLCNAWVYMDVIARLTSVESDESNDFDSTFVFSGNPNDCPPLVMGDRDPGFGIDFGMPIDARLDPFMGCANTLFPLIGRVANLVRRVCRSTVNSPALISQANDLKAALEGWDPPAFIERPEDPSTDVQHTLQTAEAYRWATLLHLHSSVPELPSLSSTELAQRVLQYLATVPLASRTTIVHIYPLMVAGCEAADEEDRMWVRARWGAMGARMRLGIIDRCATVAEEVWRRRDNYEAQPLGNRKLVATADLQPSRGRGQPLLRGQNGQVRLGDPGRTGMVFSYVEDDDEPEDPNEDEQWKRMRARARDRRNGRDPRMQIMDPAYTVRGHLHWVGVMWDWGWESRLSQ
jgi:hypothetical protein